jgi:hypothetical protein
MNFKVPKSGGSLVGTWTGYGLDDRGSEVRFPVTAANFPLLHRVQIDSGTHPASYPMSSGRFSPGVKRPGREADHSLTSRDEVKNVWRYTSTLPIRHPYLSSILMLSSHLRLGLRSGLFPPGLPTKTLNTSPLPHACHMSRPPHPRFNHHNNIR